MKKKGLRKLVLILFCMIAIGMTAVPASAAVYRKTTAAVNVRSKAGSTSAGTLVTTIPEGKKVTLIGTSTKYSNWYYIEYNGKKGFVKGTYLAKITTSDDDDDDDDDEEEDDDGSVTKKTTTGVYMRSSGKIADNIITLLPKGTKVTMLSTVGNWSKVRTSNGRTGYVYSTYLTSDSSSSSSSSSGTYRTTAVGLNLRRAPKIASGNVILTIPAGKKVKLLSLINNWYKVKYNSHTGYVKSGYFTEETDTSTVTETVTVNLYFRSSRKISSGNIITVIPKGKKVKVLKEYSNNWFYVQYNGKKGYVKGGYFASDDSSSSSSSSSSGATKKTTANLRIRSSRSTSSSSNILDVIPKGTKVTIKASYSSGWSKVTYNGQTGYVSSEYLS